MENNNLNNTQVPEQPKESWVKPELEIFSVKDLTMGHNTGTNSDAIFLNYS